MSLADELLADLEEAAEEEEGGSYGEEEEEPAIEDVQEETQLDLSGDSVKSIAKLWDSKMVRGHEGVDGYKQKLPGARVGAIALLEQSWVLTVLSFPDSLLRS